MATIGPEVVEGVRSQFEAMDDLLHDGSPTMDRLEVEDTVNRLLEKSGLSSIFRVGPIALVPAERVNGGVHINRPKDNPDVIVFTYQVRPPQPATQT